MKQRAAKTSNGTNRTMCLFVLILLVGGARPVGAAGGAGVVNGTNGTETAALYPILTRFREASLKGEWESAFKVVDRNIEKFPLPHHGLMRLLKGRALERSNKLEEAQGEFRSGLSAKGPYEALLRFSLSHVASVMGRSEEVKQVLNQLLSQAARDPADVPPAMKMRAVLEYADQLSKSERWSAVAQLLQPVLRKARGSEIYPSMLFSLYRAKRHVGVSDCRLARDLYAKYPSLPELKDWGPLLPENAIDGLKPGCSATAKDIQTRLRRLQLGGQIERSVNEIRLLRERGVFPAWTIDTMEVNALLAQGRNSEAMKALLKHSKENSGRPAFWLFFGKISSRLGDFSAAAGAYKKAYDLAPRAKTASEALFNSSFASYQMQDYDGAEAGFQKLSKRYGHSKIARDARWHLAWMSYLRHDYENALKGWNALLNERKSGRRRRLSGDAVSIDRIQYWGAMALLQLGRRAEAIERFRSLIRDPSLDYYSILAWYRLKALPGVELTESEKRMIFKAGPDEIQTSVEADETSASGGEAESVADAPIGPEGVAENGAVENGDGVTEDAAPESEGPGPIAEDGSLGSAALDEVIPSASVRDPALQKRLERVRLLFAAGFEEETRWELQNLDRRVRNNQDRRTMMSELHRMGRWDRSSVLAELTFAPQRIRGGLTGARDLWEFAYPKAWNEFVTGSSRSASIDEDIVWSIMRAESHYRSDARSAVGASGLMQIMPFTGERVALDLLGKSEFQARDLFDPEVNIRIGARYLKRLAEKFSVRLPLVAAGYNAGPHRVQAWLKGFGGLSTDAFIEHIPFVETRNYVKKVIRNYQIYRLLYRDDRGSLGWIVKPVGVSPDDGPSALEVW